jgi:hypothetical protein
MASPPSIDLIFPYDVSLIPLMLSLTLYILFKCPDRRIFLVDTSTKARKIVASFHCFLYDRGVLIIDLILATQGSFLDPSMPCITFLSSLPIQSTMQRNPPQNTTPNHATPSHFPPNFTLPSPPSPSRLPSSPPLSLQSPTQHLLRSSPSDPNFGAVSSRKHLLPLGILHDEGNTLSSRHYSKI